jgi:hypothetical protein
VVAERFRCALHALADAEPVHGTASTVRRWLLREQPGPWGVDALVDSRLPPAVGAELRRRARQVRARPVLIRRPARSRLDRPRQVFVAASCGPRPWVERHILDHPAQVLDLDLGPLGADQPTGGQPLDRPLYLICTNGRHDACCAEFGRPLAAALAAARPEETWECSHIGGDRFAGNLVALPAGHYFGRVDPDRAIDLVAALEGGVLDLQRYRGRSCYPFAVQAAEWLVRARERLDRIDDLTVQRFDGIDGGVRVWLHARPDRHLVAHVAVRPDAVPRPLTCTATTQGSPPRFTLVDLREAADDDQ